MNISDKDGMEWERKKKEERHNIQKGKELLQKEQYKDLI